MNRIILKACVSISFVLIMNLPVLFADTGHKNSGIKIGSPGKASAATRTIEVSVFDNYYEPKTIEVKKGETVRFVIKNKGQFVHEFNIGTAAMHAEHQKQMVMMVEHGVLEADKINHNMMSMKMPDGSTMEHNDPNSKLIEPGKTEEIVWTFSENAKLEYACNVPGHYDVGMFGKISIK